MTRTREQAREQQRAYRERKRAEEAAKIVAARSIMPTMVDQQPPADPAEIRGPGEFERKVQAELDELGDLAVTVMPGMAGNAIAMARILDNPAAIMQHAGASSQLRAALLALHEVAKTGQRSSGKVRMLRARHAGDGGGQVVPIRPRRGGDDG